MKPILIILNGHLSHELDSIDSDSYSEIVCADGAIEKINLRQVNVTKVFGDFDSIGIKKNDIDYIELENQDFTDFEKILMHYEKLNISHFHVLGASGLEQDHFLGHLSIAKKYLNKMTIHFSDAYHDYFVLNQSIELKNCLNKMISVIPLPEVHGLSYTGLQYHLEAASLRFGDRIGTRNKAVNDSVEISFDSGCIAVFKEK